MPQLTDEERARIAARNKIVEQNLGLAGAMARRYMGVRVPFMDLMQEGTIGLMRAAEEFDPTRGVHFSTYARYWIHEAIQQYLMNCSWMIRLPVKTYRILRKIRRRSIELGHPDITDALEDTMESLGLTREQRALARYGITAKRASLGSLDDDGDDALRTLVWPNDPDHDQDFADNREAREEFARRLGLLSEREQIAVTMACGLAGDPPAPCRVIGDRLGISREWARKIEKLAVAKLSGKVSFDETASGNTMKALNAKQTGRRPRASRHPGPCEGVA